MDDTQREITKIAREVSRFTVKAMRADGIGTGEIELIHAVRHSPGITQAELSKKLGVDKAAVARQAASLEGKGYIELRPNPADGRSRLLYPTEKAQSLRNSKAGVEEAFYSWLLEDLTEEERAAFAATLHRLYLKCKAESRGGFRKMTERISGEG